MSLNTLHLAESWTFKLRNSTVVLVSDKRFGKIPSSRVERYKRPRRMNRAADVSVDRTEKTLK